MTRPSLKTDLGARKTASFGLVDSTLLLVATIWGTNNVVARATFGEFEPGAFIVLRFAIATVIMLVFLRFTEPSCPIDRADWPRFLLAGLLGTALVQPLFYYGLALSTTSNISLIKATAPIFVAILANFLFGERCTSRGWLGCGLTLAGMLLIVEEGWGFNLHGHVLLGDLLALAGAVLWAAYMVVVGPLTKRYSALRVTAVTTLIGTIPLVVLGSPLLAAQDWGRLDVWGLSGLFYSAVFGVFVAYVLWNAGIQKIGSTRTAIYQNLSPVIATLVAAAFLGESITLARLAGGAIIFLGLYLVRSSKKAVTPSPVMVQDGGRLLLTSKV
jgi:drug/metabolite transporter (DMT)-like permease